MLVTGRKERERVSPRRRERIGCPMLVSRNISRGERRYSVADSRSATLVVDRDRLHGDARARHRIVGTLQAKGLIKDRQPILLAEFENRAPDSTLGPTLTEALRVDLSQSETVKLLDGEAVGGALTRMQKPATTVLTPAIARELAQREGVPAIVEGEIDPVGKSYVISAKVISAANGSSLTALRETAASDAELIPAIDRLSRALRERIGESLVTIRADEPLEHVTTIFARRAAQVLAGATTVRCRARR